MADEDAERLVVAPDQLLATTDRAIDVCLMSRSYGDISGLKWWQLANALTAITLHDQWSGTKKYAEAVQAILGEAQQKQSSFINEFNDDCLWWALACLAVYSTYSPKQIYLTWAHRIQRHVAQTVVKAGRMRVCEMDMGGACHWKPGEEDVNSITTGLFVELSAELVRLDPQLANCKEDDQVGGCFNIAFLQELQKTISPRPPERRRQYLSSAKQSLGWIERCRLSPDHYVYDTIKTAKQEKVDWCFTYLQGQLISAAVALIAVSPPAERGHLCELAVKTAEAVMVHPSWCEPDGTLTEPNAFGPGDNGWENNDAVGFKSIYVRALAKLYACLDTSGLEQYAPFRARIKKFVNKQFNSLQTRNVNENAQYGAWWAGPFDCATSHAQMAALDVMAAVHRVNR